jgi:hypothetical protein
MLKGKNTRTPASPDRDYHVKITAEALGVERFAG